jgi:predicted RNA binding protein YcfA (HicA-like mRNA interferase family)
MNYREVTRKLLGLGCTEIHRRGGGSHRKWFNPATRRAVVLPDHGARDLRLGTLRAVVRQLGLGWESFRDA